VLVACYLPQALVLGALHSRCLACRGRHKLGALCFGLPQLALPQGTDSRIARRRWSPLGPVSRSHLGDQPPGAIAASLGRVLTQPVSGHTRRPSGRR